MPEEDALHVPGRERQTESKDDDVVEFPEFLLTKCVRIQFPWLPVICVLLVVNYIDLVLIRKCCSRD